MGDNSSNARESNDSDDATEHGRESRGEQEKGEKGGMLRCHDANKFVSWQGDFQDGCIRTNNCASLDRSKE